MPHPPLPRGGLGTLRYHPGACLYPSSTSKASFAIRQAYPNGRPATFGHLPISGDEVDGGIDVGAEVISHPTGAGPGESTKNGLSANCGLGYTCRMTMVSVEIPEEVLSLAGLDDQPPSGGPGNLLPLLLFRQGRL